MNAGSRWSTLRKIGLGLAGMLVLVVIALALMAVIPPKTSNLASHPNPAASYAEAVQRVTAIQAQETAGYNPLCRTQLLTHGQKTARAIAKQIEDELTYPGEVKVTLIREMRITEYAR